MKDRWHIGFYTNTYHPTMSGVVRSIETFKKIFTDMGNNVFIFAQKTSKYEDSEPFVFRYPALEVPFANDYAFPVPYSLSIDEILPALKLDVIHSHHPFLLGETAARKSKSLGIPLVFTFHTRYDEYMHYVPIGEDLTKFIVDRWMNRYLEKCHHIITPSESMKEILIQNGVVGAITTIPTGIDVTPFQRADGQTIREKRGWGDNIVLITLGRLAKEKSFDTVIKAAALILKKRDGIRLVIVGDGMEEKNLQKLARELGIANKVEFTGTIPFEQVPLYLKAADIFCFASVTETQGLVTMEAMAAGLPVVAVAATGTSDTVEHGIDGLLTENDPLALAEGIELIINNEDLRRRLKEGAKAKLDWLDIRRQAQRTLEVYRQAQEAQKENRHIRTGINDIVG